MRFFKSRHWCSGFGFWGKSWKYVLPVVVWQMSGRQRASRECISRVVVRVCNRVLDRVPALVPVLSSFPDWFSFVLCFLLSSWSCKGRLLRLLEFSKNTEKFFFHLKCDRWSTVFHCTNRLDAVVPSYRFVDSWELLLLDCLWPYRVKICNKSFSCKRKKICSWPSIAFNLFVLFVLGKHIKVITLFSVIADGIWNSFIANTLAFVKLVLNKKVFSYPSFNTEFVDL